MMAFEHASKRSAQDLGFNPIEPKKRKVKFSDQVMMHTAESHNAANHDGSDVSAEMYKKFVRSALDELENVCFYRFISIFFCLQVRLTNRYITIRSPAPK